MTVGALGSKPPGAPKLTGKKRPGTSRANIWAPVASSTRVVSGISRPSPAHWFKVARSAGPYRCPPGCTTKYPTAGECIGFEPGFGQTTGASNELPAGPFHPVHEFRTRGNVHAHRTARRLLYPRLDHPLASLLRWPSVQRRLVAALDGGDLPFRRLRLRRGIARRGVPPPLALLDWDRPGARSRDGAGVRAVRGRLTHRS